jgi:two-component system nitrogen regulation response regulator GlnG
MSHLLIVDDEPSICWGLAKLAEKLGHSATVAASAEQGLAAAEAQRPDAIVLDVRLPGMSGVAAMRHFREVLGPVPIIVITAFGDLATAVEAVRNGAFEYLLKPFDLAVAQRAIERAVESLAQPAEATSPRRGVGDEETIVGHSGAIQAVFKRIAVVAPSDACVHLRGESGTGKELAARAVHRYSRRAAGPFVAVNVASLSPSLAESELFGHARGAFTGADQRRKGFLEQAHGGTIFLDEVADIPLGLQVKLLRVLEHGEILPVGGEGPMQSDFRLISATHQNLYQRVAEGAFRHDLYYRLVTFEIEIPPLRERRGDIAELAAHFLDVLAAKKQGGEKGTGPICRNGPEAGTDAERWSAHKLDLSPFLRPAISAEAMAELERREWFGNVRELRNAIEHAVILARGGPIAPEHLPSPIVPAGASKMLPEKTVVSLVREWAELQLQDPAGAEDLYDRLLKLVEPPLLEAALERCGGQCLAAARRLGLHRTTLRKKLDELGISDT